MNDIDLVGLTADIVSAHVSHNNVTTADVPTLIHTVYEALSKTGQPEAEEIPALEPAVSIRNSIKPDFIVCLEDGKKLKMLKRYLRTNYNMSPEEYRAKWGLPKDYPMVAPSYRQTRSALAHQIGLGRKKVVETAPVIAKAASKPAKRGAKKAATKEAPAATKPAPRKRLGISTAKSAARAHLGAKPATT